MLILLVTIFRIIIIKHFHQQSMTPNRVVTSPNVTNLIEEKHGSDKKEYTTLKKNLVYTMYIMFIFQICFILFYLVLL